MNKPIPKARLLVVVVENKGGAGKSTITALAVEHFKAKGDRVHVVDTDATNSTTYATYRDGFVPIQPRKELAAIEDIGTDLLAAKYDTVVIDVGARDENIVKPMIIETALTFQDTDCALLVIRPITLNAYVQNNATRFADSISGLGIPVILARCNWPDQDQQEYFLWEQSKSRERLINGYCVELMIHDFTNFIVTNASSLGLSLGKLAVGDFSGVDKNAPVKPEVLFQRRHQLLVKKLLAKQSNDFDAVIREALGRVGYVYTGR